MTWHADTDTLTAYATGTIDDARAFSLEAHLLACATCRDACAAMTSPARLDAVWAEMLDTVDRPKVRVTERALHLIGVREHIARLIAATPTLQMSWLLAVAATLGFAVVASHGSPPNGPGALIFLLIAPLVPLAGVAGAYGPGIDPTYEMGMAAPMRGFRLLLIRVAAVVLSTMVLTGIAALALPGPGWAATAWLLPALALAAATLALGTVVEARTAATILAGTWIAAVTVIERVSDTPLASFRATGQLVSLGVMIAGVLLVTARRERIDRA